MHSMPQAKRPRPVDLWVCRALTLGPVAAAFPVAAVAVFALGTDRGPRTLLARLSGFEAFRRIRECIEIGGSAHEPRSDSLHCEALLDR